MPKRISDSELDAIKQAIDNFSAGALIEDISNALSQAFNRRTLQRRLALLVDRGQLVVEGCGRATRYKIASSNVVQVGMAYEKDIALPISVINPLPVSVEGARIRQAVQLPVSERKPVVYQRDFVGAYKPNQTFYLSEKTRQHLNMHEGNMARYRICPSQFANWRSNWR